MATRVILADDHGIVRAGLRSLIEDLPDAEVLAEAENGRTAVELARTLRPDVVVMDIAMSDLNGIEATRQIMEEAPGVKVIGLSMHSDRRFVEGMLGAGASGYLLKDAAFEDLADAIRTVMAGRVYLCAEIAGIVVEGFVKGGGGGAPSPLDMLTRREREVLQLLAEGKRTKQIASELGVSVKTVESHRSRLMNKLGTHSVAELTKYAIREGLTSL
ncbi:MAG: LuxR family transcriptional regulator [Planctomycetes bacterium SM23_32]|nr:MAG: LuxR family transcriptional regulator [Planctomycetes bacterium SM23_32]